MLKAIMNTVLFATLTAGALLGANVSTAHAWLKICNHTDVRVQYHHSRWSSTCDDFCSGNPWIKEGWWVMDPDECKTVYGGSANNRWFYFYAEQVGGPLKWTSSSWYWGVPSNAHDLCHCVGCVTGGGGACYPYYYHIEKQATATNTTWNLTE